MTSVTTEQPLPLAEANSVLLENGPIKIRTLKDTDQDSEFAANIMVDSFERKFIHVTSRRSLPSMKDFYGRSLRGRPPVFYERNLIAEYDGEMAGSCVLRYHGDSELFPDVRDEDFAPVKCTDKCGLMCFALATAENIPPETCFLDHIGVASKFRGKGIGKLLLDMADIDAKRKGCKITYLSVTTSNRSQRLYERQGYVVKETKTLCCCGYWCTTGEREFAFMEKNLKG